MDAKRQEAIAMLRRQLKGQLNRLAEANMHKIAVEIEKLYMQNPRNDMNTALVSLITDSLVSPTLAKERMVLEHVLLIAILHANIGSEIGAFFLEQIVTQMHELLGQIDTLAVEDKKLDNFIFILAHMNTYKILQHKMIFEILDKLTENFSEKAVECILLVLKSIGFTLRKDDPLALKDLIHKIQKRANEAIENINEKWVFLYFILKIKILI